MIARRLVAVLLSTMFAPVSTMAQTAPAPQTPPPACAAPEHRQFDFWVGSWDVYRTGTDQLVAHSRIERLFADCVIRETWMPLRGGGGGSSFNSWRPDARQWRQLWVDASNGWVNFTGGLAGDAMVLTGAWRNPDGTPNLMRMTYTRGADGSVRQAGAVSLDQGATWRATFDFTYRPAASD